MSQWAPSVPSTERFFDQIVSFSMSKPSPRTFDNSLKWITFFFTLNWICDGMPAVLRKDSRFSVVPDRAYFRQKSLFIKILLQKKAVCGLYPRSKSTGYKIWWRACRRYGCFLMEKKRFHRRQSGKSQFVRRLKRRIPTERGGNACGEN